MSSRISAGTLGAPQAEALGAIRRHEDLVAFLLEGVRQQPLDIRVIVDDEDLRGHCLPSVEADHRLGGPIIGAPIPAAGSSRRSKTSWLQVSRRSATARTSASVANLPLSLLVSRMATGRPPGVGHEDHPEVDPADLGRIVVEQPDQARLGLEVRLDLLAPLRRSRRARPPSPGFTWPPTPIDHRSWRRAIGTGPGPLHQEVARSVAHDEVRDHLLPARIGLDVRSQLELALEGDRLEHAGQVLGPDAVPATARDHRRAGHDQDLLAQAAAGPTGRSAGPAAQARSIPLRGGSRIDRVASSLEVGQPVVELGAQRAQTPGKLRGVRRRDPRAHRLIAPGQAGGAQPASRGQPLGERPVLGGADGLDEGRGDDEGQVADRGDGPVVLRGPSQ